MSTRLCSLRATLRSAAGSALLAGIGPTLPGLAFARMGPWIAAAVVVSIAAATLSLARASSSPMRGMSLAAGVVWIVAALSWMATFSNEYERIGLAIAACASVLGSALIVLAARQRGDATAPN